MLTEFTPIQSLIGGMMIGTAAVLLMALLGKIMGATGILAGVLPPTHWAAQNARHDGAWRLGVLLGMISSPLVFRSLSGELPEVTVPVSYPMLGIGGLLVGLGVSFASGCTSGHGVCGNARLSPRSMVATVMFMLSSFVTVYLVRHVFGV